ncbi:MAG: metallophosphoesterase family protein [Verrucomicrobia bacterium]|nr:metallophosphoesterase family protein [Verrucomicrobiota bacterium]
MKIGLISDTHGHLDPRISAVFAGVEHILHAGDIGSESLLDALRVIAPVTAVLGNTDNNLRDRGFRNVERCKLGGRAFLLIHAGRPHDLSGDMRQMIFDKDKPDVVVFGHTHQPERIVENGVTFINPGSASRPRMHQPPTVAIAEIHADGRIEVRWLKLDA